MTHFWASGKSEARCAGDRAEARKENNGGHGYGGAGTFDKHRHGELPVSSWRGVCWALEEWEVMAG